MSSKAELTTGSASAATEHTEEPHLRELVTLFAFFVLFDVIYDVLMLTM